MDEIVGILNQRVIELLNLSYKQGSLILCGDSNKEHMKLKHEDDYDRYIFKLKEIIHHPTYVCKQPNKDSIEYIKVYYNKQVDYVLVAVRATNNNILYARTLFVMSEEKKQKYAEKNRLLKY